MIPQFKLPESNNLISIDSELISENEEILKISDRNNIILLYLCNCLFYDDETGKCSLEHLKSECEEFSPEFVRLFRFYKNYKFIPFEITEEMRKDWYEVVHDLPDVKEKDGGYTFTILYDDSECPSVLTPGILNYIHVLAKICIAEKLLIETMKDVDMSQQNILLDKIGIFLAKISYKDFRIKIESEKCIPIIRLKMRKGFVLKLGHRISDIKSTEQQDFTGTFTITFNHICDTEVIMEMKLGEVIEKAVFKIKGTIKEPIVLKTLPFLNSEVSKKFLSSFFANEFDNLYNQGSIAKNEQKKKYLIHLFKLMEENPNLDHEAIKRIIGNVVKSVDLSNQQARSTFSPFFAAVKDLFNSDEEIREIWMSLYTKNSKAKLDVVRNFWTKHIKGLVEIKKLEISKADSYPIDRIKLILDTVKDKLKILKISNVENKDRNEFLKILENFLKENNTLTELTLNSVGLYLPENMKIFADGLKQANTLKTLSIPSSYFCEEGAKLLAGGLKENKSITSLDVSNNHLEIESLGHLADVLANKEIITFLNISSNSLRAEAEGLFLNALSKLKHVKTLDISSCSLTELKIQELAEFLGESTSIETLKLKKNNLGEASAEILAGGLQKNNSLTSLDVSVNNLKLKGLECLAGALANKKNITSLNISSNCLKTDEKMAFLNALRKLAHVKTLNISFNGLTVQNIQEFAIFLGESTSIKTLDFAGMI